MTPYAMSVLIHYYGHAEDHPDLQRNPPVWRPTIEGLVIERLLRERNSLYDRLAGGPRFLLTKTGMAYVEALGRVLRKPVFPPNRIIKEGREESQEPQHSRQHPVYCSSRAWDGTLETCAWPWSTSLAGKPEHVASCPICGTSVVTGHRPQKAEPWPPTWLGWNREATQ